MPTPRAGTAPALALRDGDVGGAGGARVLGARPDEPVVAVLLENVRGPAGHAAHREDRRELVGRDAHGRIARAGEQVHVRVDVLLLGHHSRHGVEDLDWAIVAVLLAELGGEPAQVLGARVLHTIDAVAEAHDARLVRDGLLDHASALAGSLILSTISMTCSLAPPCSGPLSAPMAEVIAEYMSERVAAVTRAAKVEALNSWSACRISATSNVFTARSVGFLPDIM